MRHGSLFAGIDGFGLASEWMGWENVFQVEWDKFCTKKLEKNFPQTKRYGDIREFDGTKYRGLIDILTGGFPCQPFSVAGKQKGKGDDRHLWPEMLRVIREVRPPWIVGENVPGIIRMELENICLALEGEGYEVQPFIIPSASIGAWDKRERVWIIAYDHSFTSNISVQQWGQNKTGNIDINGEIEIYHDTDQINGNNAGYNTSTISQQQATKVQLNSNFNCESMEGHSWYEFTKRQKDEIRRNGQSHWLRDWIEVASELCRSNARVPNRMDRIKALGNSVNPYVVYQIFKLIDEFANIQNKE